MLLRPGIIFFFELLQRIPPTFGPNQRLSYYRVGWSFIRPDLALREADKDGSPLSLKLQVFSYRRRLKIEKTPNRMTVKSVTDDEVPTQVPHVLYEYAWPCRVMQESRLSICLELVDASQENAAASLTTQRKMSFDGKTLATEQAARETKLQECMIQKSDLTSEWPVPDELMHIFPTHDRGCYRMCLSTSGTLLVAACEGAVAKYELRIYELNSGNLRCVLEGHSALVYDLCWFSGDDELVMSCSGDGRCLIFMVPPEHCDTAISPHISLYHPSHLYSCRIHPQSTSSHLVIACAGLGFGFRLWNVQRRRDAQEDPPPKNLGDVKSEDGSDIYCLRFSRGENLITAHANGYLALWRVTWSSVEGVTWQQLRLYQNPDMQDIPIYSFEVITEELLQRSSSASIEVADDWVLLHTKDNLVRVCSLQHSSIRVMQQFPVKNSRFGCRGAISPSGEHILIGCETGQVTLFSVATGQAVEWIAIRLSSPVCDIVWSRRHHIVAICAYEADEPPILAFYYPREVQEGASQQQVSGFRPPERSPMSPIRESTLIKDSLKGRVTQSTETWAVNWLELQGPSGGGPLGMNRKQQMKASILGEVLDQKTHAELEARISTQIYRDSTLPRPSSSARLTSELPRPSQGLPSSSLLNGIPNPNRPNAGTTTPFSANPLGSMSTTTAAGVHPQPYTMTTMQGGLGFTPTQGSTTTSQQQR